MRIETEYPKSDGVWEPVAGWLAAERQRLEREDLGSKRNQNRPPNKKVRGAAVAAPPRNRSSAYPAKSARLPSLILYPGMGSNGTEKEQVCRYRSGKKEHGSVHSLRREAPQSSQATKRTQVVEHDFAQASTQLTPWLWKPSALAFVLSRQVKQDVVLSSHSAQSGQTRDDLAIDEKNGQGGCA